MNTSSHKATILAVFLLAFFAGCTTLPTPRQSWHSFPKEAHVEAVSRPYVALGLVRAKVNYPSLDPKHEEDELCRNYYNQSVKELVKLARDRGGEAVVEVRSVVFLETGQQELHPSAECSDDGEEGQSLTQGIAVKWKLPSVQAAASPSPGPAPSPSPSPEEPRSAPTPRVHPKTNLMRRQVEPIPSRALAGSRS